VRLTHGGGEDGWRPMEALDSRKVYVDRLWCYDESGPLGKERPAVDKRRILLQATSPTPQPRAG
jgi:hypothetical protein